MSANRSSVWTGTRVILCASGGYRTERVSRRMAGWVFIVLAVILFVLALAGGAALGLGKEDVTATTGLTPVALDGVFDACQAYAQSRYPELDMRLLPEVNNWFVSTSEGEMTASCYLLNDTKPGDVRCKCLTFRLEHAYGEWRVTMVNLR